MPHRDRFLGFAAVDDFFVAAFRARLDSARALPRIVLATLFAPLSHMLMKGFFIAQSPEIAARPRSGRLGHIGIHLVIGRAPIPAGFGHVWDLNATTPFQLHGC